MTPEQIQALAQGIAEGVSSKASWLTNIFLVLCAGLSAYFGSYLRKRAEYKAAHEEFQTLKRQLVETTQSVEEIKLSLAGKGWVRQQHWAHREKHYLELLSRLWTLMFCSEALFVYHGQGGNNDDSEHKEQYERKLVEQRSAALDALMHAIGPAAVFLPDPAMKYLREIIAVSESIKGEAGDAYEFYGLWGEAAKHAYDAVLAEARKDLATADFAGSDLAPQ